MFIDSTDAPVAEYSSIYYDYLLCDKPVALIWEDIEEYKKKPGFAVDLEYHCKGVEKIYTAEDFEKFIVDLAEGKDRLKREREEICKMANYSCDGKNSQRVVDFICKDAHL